MYTKPNYEYCDTGIEVDLAESEKTVENMINAKKRSLKSKIDDESDFEIVRDIKKLEIGEPEDFKLAVDIRTINKLFIKIVYEFACVCLDSKYLDEDRGLLFKNTIINRDYDVFLEKNIIKFSCDKRKLDFFVRKVGEVAHDNTINFHYGSPLSYCSNGNYNHEIRLIKKNNKFFVEIDLFDIFKYIICVSDNADDYSYGEGLIAKLITGQSDGDVVNKTEGPFEEVLSRFRYTN